MLLKRQLLQDIFIPCEPGKDLATSEPKEVGGGSLKLLHTTGVHARFSNSPKGII